MHPAPQPGIIIRLRRQRSIAGQGGIERRRGHRAHLAIRRDRPVCKAPSGPSARGRRLLVRSAWEKSGAIGETGRTTFPVHGRGVDAVHRTDSPAGRAIRTPQSFARRSRWESVSLAKGLGREKAYVWLLLVIGSRGVICVCGVGRRILNPV